MSGFFFSNSRRFTTPQPRGLSPSDLCFEKSPLNVCEIYSLTKDYRGYEFKRIPKKKLGESENFSGSKFGPTTGVKSVASTMLSLSQRA